MLKDVTQIRRFLVIVPRPNTSGRLLLTGPVGGFRPAVDTRRAACVVCPVHTVCWRHQHSDNPRREGWAAA